MRFSLSLIMLLISAQAFARPAVNILSWWDYINSKKLIKLVEEDKCNVDVSIDEFYSNDEFSRESENRTTIF